MSTCVDVGSVIESEMSVVQTSNVGFTSEVSDYLEVHTGPELQTMNIDSENNIMRSHIDPGWVRAKGEREGEREREGGGRKRERERG